MTLRKSLPTKESVVGRPVQMKYDSDLKVRQSFPKTYIMAKCKWKVLGVDARIHVSVREIVRKRFRITEREDRRGVW